MNRVNLESQRKHTSIPNLDKYMEVCVGMITVTWRSGFGN